MKTVANNKKAYFEYFIEDTYEAGVVLVGSEVKSIRQGNISLKDSFARFVDGEIYLVNAQITPFQMGSAFNPEPRRNRKLLLKRHEIDKIRGKVSAKGYTLVATKVYFKGGLVKVELGLAKGKELHDKRRSIKEKDLQRELQREV
jgi:SsrA-binding protein